MTACKTAFKATTGMENVEWLSFALVTASEATTKVTTSMEAVARLWGSPALARLQLLDVLEAVSGLVFGSCCTLLVLGETVGEI
jgi:hypothetical protein